MASDLVKGKPLSKEETRTLLQLIEGSKIITSKTTNATNNKLKKLEWKQVADKFNETATSRRTPQQLRLKWENLKKNSRKRSMRIRMSNIKTGGGVAEYIPPDDILDRVSSLLGNTGSGFVVQCGGDEKPEAFVVKGCGSDDDDGSNVNFPDAKTSVISSVDSIPALTTHLDKHRGIECQEQDKQIAQKPTFHVLRKVKKRLRENKDRQSSQSTIERNLAIAEYFKVKKQLMDGKMENISLQNEKLKLEIEKLRNSN